MMLLMLLVSVVGLIAQRTVQTGDITSEKPRLVLWLVVDNLSNEQLRIVLPRLGNDGFKRLLNGGTQMSYAYYDAGGNYAGKNMATLFTGAPALLMV